MNRNNPRLWRFFERTTTRLAARFGLASVAALLLLASVAHAEPPHVSYIFPAGGQRGTKVEFRIGGHYLHEQCPLVMKGPGVTASPVIHRAESTIWFEGPVVLPPASSRKEDYPSDYLGAVEIAADAPLGNRYWQVHTSQGVTPRMRFVVGDLPEVVENEIDGAPVPIAVPMPVTINGRIFPREDVDSWTIEAEAGREIACAVVAQQIGSPLEARLEVRAPGGEVIAESKGPPAIDPTLRFSPPKDGRYEIRIHDVNLGGLQNYVYRLTITDGPWIDRVYPLGGRRGSEVKFTASGQGASGQLSARVAADAAARWQHRFTMPRGAANAILLAAGDFPELLEAEPNNDSNRAALVAAPSVVNGRIDKPGDVDLWAVEMTKGDKLEFANDAAGLGSPLDSVLILRDAEGVLLARNDDGAAGNADAQLTFTAKADGRHFVEVSERFSRRGGDAFAYRLTIAPPKANAVDFDLTVPADVINVDRGGEAKLQINLIAKGGFAAEVTLSAEGLPKNVTVDEVKLAAKRNKATLVFKAAEDASLELSQVRIAGTAELEGKRITRYAKFVTAPGEPSLGALTLAVTEPTPFKIAAEYEFSFVPRGSVHFKRFTIDRGGYAGPLEVQLAERQTRHLQGVSGPKIIVPAGVDEFRYPVYLPPWMLLGRTSRSVLMATGVVDGPGGTKHKVCFSSATQNDQIIIRVSPALIRLDAPAALALQRSSSVDLEVGVLCNAQVTSPVEVRLLVPPHVRGISSAPVTVEPGKTTASLPVVCDDAPGPLNMPFTVRAVSGDGNERIVGETKIEILLP